MRVRRRSSAACGRRRAAGARSSSDRERGAHPELRDDGAQRRAVQAPAEAVDEQQLEHDVDDVGDDDDAQRRAQVADAAQVALAGERDQRARQAERADAQVAGGEVGDLAVAADQRHQRRGEAATHARVSTSADAERQPQRLRGDLARARVLARRRAAARPAPSCRRSRKLQSVTTAPSTVAASASAASCGVPRWPTIAVSTSR